MSTVSEKVACAVLCATVFAGTGAAEQAKNTPPPVPSTEVRQVLLDGRSVELRFTPKRKRHIFSIGPWKLLHILREKPDDRDPNLYIVAPGTQYADDGESAYDHNEIINTLPLKRGSREWDVYWAIVLDPSVKEDLRSERQLLLITQQGFSPDDHFTFDQIPGAAFLRDFVKIDTLEGLDRFRRSDGTLPRVVIVPAGFSVTAEAIDPLAPPMEKSKERISNALSVLPRGHQHKSLSNRAR